MPWRAGHAQKRRRVRRSDSGESVPDAREGTALMAGAHLSGVPFLVLSRDSPESGGPHALAQPSWRTPLRRLGPARQGSPPLFKRRTAPWEPLSYPRRRLLLQTLAPKSPPPLELHTSSSRRRRTTMPPHPCSFLPPPKLRRRVSEVEPLFSPLILLSSARFSSPELRRSTSTSSAPSAEMAPLLKP